MKFRILFLAALFVMSFAVTACSDDPENQQNQQDTGITDDGDTDDVSGDGDGDDVSGDGDTDDAGTGDADTGDTEDAGDDDDGDAGTGDTDTGGTEDAGDDDAGDAGDDDAGDTGLPGSCAEAEGNLCNSNYDCPAEERCTSLSDEEIDFCCVPGERGTDEAGEPCDEVDGQETCASGLCLSLNESPHLCTKMCDSAEECPETMNECGPIPLSGPDDWCLPQ